MLTRIARILVAEWDELNGFTRFAIEQLAGSALVQAITNGVNAVVSYLKSFSQSVIDKLGSLLGV